MYLISIIICTRNRASEVSECLEALAPQSKLFDDVEVLVIDNGSTDNTKEVVSMVAGRENAHIRYVYEGVPGLCQARNTGAREANGEYLAYIDDDERIGPDWILKIKQFFSQNHYDSVGGKVAVTIEGEPPLPIPGSMMWFFGQSSLGEVAKVLTYPSHPQGGNFVVKRKAFMDTGGFDTNLKLYGDETEFFRRFSRKGYTMYYDPDILVTQSIPAERLVLTELKQKAYKWGQGSATHWMLDRNKAGRRTTKLVEYVFRTLYIRAKLMLKKEFGAFFTYWFTRGYLHKLTVGLESKEKNA
jgi:glycosyltransferase involved in cell wall biosynthesis